MRAKIIDENVMKYVYEKDGWLYWNVNKHNVKKDSLAGSLHKSNGYYRVEINGKSYLNHRILYQIYNNVILTETDIIDHIDRNPQNNSKENLRLSDNSENNCNRKAGKNNISTGFKNIYIKKQGHYEYYNISISKNGKRAFCKTLPITTPIEELIEIRDEQLKLYHGSFHNLG